MSKDRALLGLKRKDKETDLYYNRYRYYEPYSARYMSKDPIGLEGGFNNLAYVSDPNQWVDPISGCMSKDRALLGLKRKDKETGLHYNRYRYYEPYSARYVSKDPIGLKGGLNNSTYVSDPNQWIDPMGLNESLGSAMKEAFVDRIPGSQVPSRLKNKPAAVQMTDRVLTGMNANVTAAALVGVSASASYDGNGKYSVKGGNTYGIALEATTTREVLNAGNLKDGKYYEACASAGAGLAVSVCGGYSMNGGFYGNIALGVGLGASLSGVSGEKRSYDPLAPKTVIDHEQLKRNQQMLPRAPLNFGGLR